MPITFSGRDEELPPNTTEIRPWQDHELWNTQREHRIVTYRLFNWSVTSPATIISEDFPAAFDDLWRRLRYVVTRINKPGAMNDSPNDLLLIAEGSPGVNTRLWARHFGTTATTGGVTELQGPEWKGSDLEHFMVPVWSAQGIIIPPRSIMRLEVTRATVNIDGILYEATNLKDLLDYN
jgi:hypothetical protein